MHQYPTAPRGNQVLNLSTATTFRADQARASEYSNQALSWWRQVESLQSLPGAGNSIDSARDLFSLTRTITEVITSVCTLRAQSAALRIDGTPDFEKPPDLPSNLRELTAATASQIKEVLDRPTLVSAHRLALLGEALHREGTAMLAKYLSEGELQSTIPFNPLLFAQKGLCDLVGTESAARHPWAKLQVLNPYD